MQGTQTAVSPELKRMRDLARERGRGRKGLLSKKRLFSDLEALRISTFADIGEKKLSHPRVANETYGKTSCIYLYCADQDERRRVERLLRRMGHRVNRDYDPGSGTVEVVVSYFKGCRWWV